MVGRLAQRAIVVTGGAGGLGRAMCRTFAAAGADVGLLDRDPEQTRAAAAEVGAALNAAPDADASAPTGAVVALTADVTRREQMSAALDGFVERFGRLDAMFNNAGINKPMHFLDVTEENWRAVLDVNALGVLIGMQESARRMIPQGAGKIVNTSSIAGRQGYPSFAPYSASKFAVNALTQAGARALAEHGITCNAFAPGVVQTPLWETLDTDLMEIGDAQRPGQAMSDFAADILRGRPATPDDLVGLVAFLAGPESDYLTGQVFMADGGMVLV